jgi:hypothetical protein
MSEHDDAMRDLDRWRKATKVADRDKYPPMLRLAAYIERLEGERTLLLAVHEAALNLSVTLGDHLRSSTRVASLKCDSCKQYHDDLCSALDALRPKAESKTPTLQDEIEYAAYTAYCSDKGLPAAPPPWEDENE